MSILSEGLGSLMRYLRDHTTINARVGGTVGLGDDGLFETQPGGMANVTSYAD